MSPWKVPRWVAWGVGALVAAGVTAVGIEVQGGRDPLAARGFVYGIGLALGLLWKAPGMVAAGLGVWLAGLSQQLSGLSALTLAGLVVAEASLGAWVTRRWAGGLNFLESLEHYGRFVILAGAVLPGVLLAGEFALLGPAANRGYLVWVQRALASGMSTLVLTPLVVLLVTQPPVRWNWPKIREITVLFVALVATATFAFTGGPDTNPLRVVLAYLPPGLVMASALAFSPRETAFLAGGLSLLVLLTTHGRVGVFALLMPEWAPLAAGAYAATCGLLGMVTSIVVDQRRRAFRDVEKVNRELEQRVRERTAELERDVAARCKVETELLRSETRLRDQLLELDQVYRSTPVGLCVLDRDLQFERANAALAASFGLPAESLVGRPLAAVAPGLAAALGAPLRQVLFSGVPLLDHEFSEPVEGQSPRRWLASFHPRINGAGEPSGVLVALTDVTMLRRTEEALRQSEARRERAEAFARTMVVHVGLDGKFLRVPPALCELLGYSAEALIAKTFEEVTHPDDRDRSRYAFGQLLRGEATNVELEKRYLTRDGRVVWVHVDSTVVRDDAGQPLHLISYLRDISRQKATEAALQAAQEQLELRIAERTAELRRANEELTLEVAQRKRAEASHFQALSRLVDLQETERAFISRELHDQLGQELNALHLGLGLLRECLHDPAALRAELDRLREQASHLIQAMHHMAWELRPPALDDFGLDIALQRYCADFARRTGLAVRFHSQDMGVERLPLRVETALYRVAQEALANVYYHAQASTVSLLLQRREDALTLIVEDNGRGFDVEALQRSGDIRQRLGLLGMEERMLLIGGSLTVESQPGEGTTVLAKVPVPLLEPTPPAGSAPRASPETPAELVIPQG